jgi:hypothetical protein
MENARNDFFLPSKINPACTFSSCIEVIFNPIYSN